MSGKTVSIIFDEVSLAWLEELTMRLSALGNLVPRPVEIIEFVRSIPRSAVTFDLKSVSTGRANDNRIVLKPSDTLLNLMSTLRAFDRHDNFIDKGCGVTI